MANRWLRHLAQFRQNNSDLKPTEVMKKARASYQQNGGAPPGGMPSMPGAKSPSTPMKMPVLPKMKGGNVVPYERQGTESNYAKVGGRRTRRQSRRSRRTRRR
jgi:hypothetical protein